MKGKLSVFNQASDTDQSSALWEIISPESTSVKNSLLPAKMGSVTLFLSPCPATILLTFISLFCILQVYYIFYSNSSLITSLWFSIYMIMSSANRDKVASFFPICMLSSSFFCLVFWVGPTVLCWIDVAKVCVFVFFPILQENFQVSSFLFDFCCIGGILNT
jgi:hypothetical protein